MKTLLYNPIFINPQAYYVFPRLTRYLQPDNESTSEPANYIGTIEVKVIAYGDTTLKRTYTNTDSIDLSEFKNTWINVSLFTKVGSCVLEEWKIGNVESDLPYIDPEVLASLKAVVIVGNKTNNDSDRAIVKNLVDPDNPFVISNAAFKLNSGFGKYEITFQYFPYRENVTNVSDSKVVFGIGGQLLIPYPAITENIPSFKIKVNGLSGTYHFRYYYRSSDGVQHSVDMAQDGYYELPICYNVQSSSDGTNCGFANNGNSINAGKGVDTDGMWLGTNRDNDYRFFNGAIYSLMTFPYSMSEFLIERQLKKHKLGTLYPDIVEFRPVIKSNASYDNIVFYYKNEKVENGTYLTVGSSIGMHICLSSNSVNEIKSITINGIPATFKFHDANNNIYQYDFNLTSKSPQKINITIDEYIRYEDIVQPYPSLFTLIDYDTEEVYSWGSKLKVGARFKGNVVNLLPNMYEWQGNVLYNGEVLDWGINPGVVAKEMVFSWNMPFKYLIDNNEPKCILSPRLLRIPNSSYKILGYIPDISGHGNNGVIHNSAYAEGSGVNEDGSYQLDGVDDFVTIPTIAGKQVLIKLNWQNKAIGNLIYDQRDNSSTTSFAIMPISINDTTNNKIAYQTKNANGITYIDGIRNEYIESYSLENIIHNITITNPDVSNKTVALGASNRTTADYFAKYALYDFMLFDDISTDDKIKQLNEYVGTEGNTEWRKTR